jgi:cysteinyl-tRNA synthetase
VDLIFPHHEDEIAQSCTYTGKDLFARYWLHGEFLNIRGTKMSKRFGNITTPRDLREDGVDAGAIRLLMFQTHYRQQLDLTDEGLAAAREGSRRLAEFQKRLQESRSESDSRRFHKAATELNRQASEALDDDLNAPRAVAALFTYMNEGNAALDAGEQPGPAALSAWQKIEGVLGVASELTVMKVTGGAVQDHELSEAPPSEAKAQEKWALAWATRRKEQKSAKNYVEADRIRELLKAAGWEVRDKQDGSIEVIRIKRAS